MKGFCRLQLLYENDLLQREQWDQRENVRRGLDGIVLLGESNVFLLLWDLLFVED